MCKTGEPSGAASTAAGVSRVTVTPTGTADAEEENAGSAPPANNTTSTRADPVSLRSAEPTQPSPRRRKPTRAHPQSEETLVNRSRHSRESDKDQRTAAGGGALWRRPANEWNPCARAVLRCVRGGVGSVRTTARSADAVRDRRCPPCTTRPLVARGQPARRCALPNQLRCIEPEGGVAKGSAHTLASTRNAGVTPMGWRALAARCRKPRGAACRRRYSGTQAGRRRARHQLADRSRYAAA